MTRKPLGWKPGPWARSASPYTVLGESRSAGRLYDLIDDGATGRVLYVLPQGLACELEETGFEKVKKIYKKHRHY